MAETLANYFSTIASDIGGNHVISLTENEFNKHSSVQMIETIYSNSSFQFKHINTKDVQDLFENLNPRKSCSDTGLGISNICIKASQKVGVLLRLRNLIPCKAKLIIYKSSILPH